MSESDELGAVASISLISSCCGRRSSIVGLSDAVSRVQELRTRLGWPASSLGGSSEFPALIADAGRLAGIQPEGTVAADDVAADATSPLAAAAGLAAAVGGDPALDVVDDVLSAALGADSSTAQVVASALGAEPAGGDGIGNAELLALLVQDQRRAGLGRQGS